MLSHLDPLGYSTSERTFYKASKALGNMICNGFSGFLKSSPGLPLAGRKFRWGRVGASKDKARYRGSCGGHSLGASVLPEQMTVTVEACASLLPLHSLSWHDPPNGRIKFKSISSFGGLALPFWVQLSSPLWASKPPSTPAVHKALGQVLGDTNIHCYPLPRLPGGGITLKGAARHCLEMDLGIFESRSHCFLLMITLPNPGEQTGRPTGEK